MRKNRPVPSNSFERSSTVDERNYRIILKGTNEEEDVKEDEEDKEDE